MEPFFCQSCSMPMLRSEKFGTNADGTRNEDYCVFCYMNGVFTLDCSMEEMIEHNLNFLDEFNKNYDQKHTPDQARALMMEYFPTLRRWKAK